MRFAFIRNGYANTMKKLISECFGQCLMMIEIFTNRSLVKIKEPIDNVPQGKEGLVLMVNYENKTVLRPLMWRKLPTFMVRRFEVERRWFEEVGDQGSGDYKVITCPVGLPLSLYSRRLTAKDDRNPSMLLELHGENKFDIPLPEPSKLVVEQAQSPFFLFQVFCVLLWMLDDYWYFALFTLIMLLMFEFIVAQNRIRNLETAREMLRPAHKVRAFLKCVI
jgi:hypothetical protein